MVEDLTKISLEEGQEIAGKKMVNKTAPGCTFIQEAIAVDS